MNLDDETLALLGYARGEDPVHEDATEELLIRGFRITDATEAGAVKDIDGRHRARDRAAMSRAYWERQRLKNGGKP